MLSFYVKFWKDRRTDKDRHTDTGNTIYARSFDAGA